MRPVTPAAGAPWHNERSLEVGMLGRLIIAVLVIGSAAFVWWQKQRSETVDIGAAVAESKADDAVARAAAAEDRAKKAEDRAAIAEAKASFFEAQLAGQTAAADDPIAAEHALHFTNVRYNGLKRDRAGRNAAQLAVTLVGDAAQIKSFHVASSAAEQWDSADGARWPIDVFHGGQLVVDAHADTVMKTKNGTTLLVLSLPVAGAYMFFPGVTFKLDMAVDDRVTSTTVAIQ